MKKLFIIACLAGFIVDLSAQKAPEGNRIDVNDNANFDGFGMLGNSLKGRRVFMTGENHSYVDLNTRLELKMLKYFHAGAGVRNFILELGSARAHFANRYINDADTMAEKYLMATTSPRYMKLFKRLRKWNLSLPDSMRVHVHGVDVERFNDLPLMRLSELLPDTNIPAGIRAGVEAVHTAAGWLLSNGLNEYREAIDNPFTSITLRQPFYINPTIHEFIRFYDSLQPSFRSWLGAGFGQVQEAVSWLREYRRWKDFENTTFQYVWREENIYRNMVRLLDSEPEARFFGQFGRCHAAYTEQNGDCGWYAYHSVINKLKERYFKNDTSILAIGVFYSNFTDYGGYNDSKEEEAIREEVRSLMKASEQESVTLFDIRSADAELPALSRKFSFAITEKNFNASDDDSLSSDSSAVITKDHIRHPEQAVYFYGLGATNTDLSALSRHNGIPGFEAADYTYRHAFGVMAIEPGTYTAFHGEVTGRQKFSSADSGNYFFGMGQFTIESGYPLVLRNRFHLLAGSTLFFGRQHLRYERAGIDFMQSPGEYIRSVTNPSWGLGLNVRAAVKLAGPFQLSIYGGSQWDLSGKGWKIKGTGDGYATGRLSTSMTGFHAGALLNISIPLDED